MEVYRSNSRPRPLRHRRRDSRTGLQPGVTTSRRSFSACIATSRRSTPEGVLRHEWLNSRGAIARFDRNTIEIRVLDVQECPAADLAICAAIVAVLQALAEERWTSAAQQQSLAVEPLAKLLNATIRTADRTIIDDPLYLAQFGASATRISARDLWRYLMEQVGGWPAHNCARNNLARRPLGDPHRTSNPRRRIAHGVGLPRLVRLPGSRTHVHKGEAHFLNRRRHFTALWRIRWARS